MAQKVNLTGRCMCGAVEFAGTATAPEVGACHCGMCRRWSSGPFFEVTCENVTFEGEGNITRFRSSDWAERGFCSKCGSNLFYRILDSSEYQIAAGLIGGQPELRLTLQVFIDSKPPFYTLADKTRIMTGEEVYAAFAPPPD